MGVFDAPVEKIWKFMNGEVHQHAAFKNVRMTADGFEAEMLHPDGTTTSKASFKLNPKPLKRL